MIWGTPILGNLHMKIYENSACWHIPWPKICLRPALRAMEEVFYLNCTCERAVLRFQVKFWVHRASLQTHGHVLEHLLCTGSLTWRIPELSIFAASMDMTLPCCMHSTNILGLRIEHKTCIILTLSKMLVLPYSQLIILTFSNKPSLRPAASPNRRLPFGTAATQLPDPNCV